MARYRDSKTGRFAPEWKHKKWPKRFVIVRPPREEEPEEIEEPEEEEQEWIASADYKKKRKPNAIRLQLHLFAPASTTKTKMKETFQQFLRTGDLPSGVTVNLIEWGKRDYDHSTDQIEKAWERFQKVPWENLDVERSK